MPEVLWHTLSGDDVLEKLESNPDGLSKEEVSKRLERFGRNELEEFGGETLFQMFLRQLKDFLIIILIFAAAISLGVAYFEGSLEEAIDAVVILIIVVFIVVVGFYQEYSAKRELEALKKILTPSAVVVRDGHKRKIDAGEVVPGDILFLESGDRISADCRIISCTSLRVDEAALTGESNPVGKNTDSAEAEAIIADQKNMVFMGTSVVYGKARAVVVATGMETELGKIASRIQTIEEEQTPLQSRLEELGKKIGWAVIVICLVVFGVGLLFQSRHPMEMFLIAVALAVAAVPEGLPGVVTVALSTGMKRMVRRNVIVRRLLAVETLGSTTVICSDKTGTLTRNEMTVRRVYVDGADVEITGEGYEPEGEFLSEGKEFKISEAAELLIRIGMICNNAEIDRSEEKPKVTGDPTEACLIVLGEKAGILKSELEKETPEVDEIPFEAERKRMTTINETPGGRMAYMKGAPDIVLELCDRIFEDGKERKLTPEDKKKILAKTDDMASNAMRVLATAYRKLEGNEKEIENDLVFVGLTGLIDPPREDAKEAVQVCKQAGIRLVMITGDHLLTAKAIGKEVHFAETDEALTGRDLDKISDEELRETVKTVSIYARVSPDHKFRIVDALRKNGQVVAMTGDGVNDAPALKLADIGVAMGIAGTDVSKEASDMVLTDDNFTSIVAAVEEGRGIYDNIRKFFAYLISGNIVEVAVIFLSIVSGLPVALTAAQILLINLVTDGLPALALGVDPFEPKAMEQKPRKRDEHIYANLQPFILYYPIIATAVTFGLFATAYQTTMNVAYAQTVAFLSIALFELYQAYASRSTKFPSLEVGIFKNPWLTLAVLFSLGVCLAIVYVPFPVPYLDLTLPEIFDTFPLPYSEFMKILVVSSLGFIYLEAAKYRLSRRQTI
ncbi:cation-translocating P-type ATPase [Candidatus Altiarchaeota archaeon]